MKPTPAKSLLILMKQLRSLLAEMPRETHRDELRRTRLEAMMTRAELFGLSQSAIKELYKDKVKA